MDTQKLLIEIEVDSEQAVQRIVEQKTAIERLKNEKKELEAANKSMSAQEKVDTDAIQRNKEAIVEKDAKIKNLTAEMRTNEKIIQSVTKETNDETGAYQKLSLEYQVAAQKAKDMAVVYGTNSVETKKATEAAYYPTVNLTANYNWQGLGPKFPLTNGKSEGVYWSDYSAIGLGINIPIFNGFATKAKVQQNQIEIDKLEADLKDTKLGLDQAYQNAKSQIENSLASIENQKANVELAESVLADTKSNYQYGLATLTDLLDAENSLVQAKNNYTTAVLDYKIAEVQYYKSKGELKTYLK